MIFLDFETASLCDLKEHGETVYAQHPSTRVLCGVAIIGPGDPIVFRSGEPIPPPLEKAILQGEPICCHNASFECALWTYCLKWPAPSRWICTMGAAAACNYPQSLDGVAAALGLGAKDERGAKLIRRYCIPYKAPKKDPVLREVPPEDMQALIEYCIQDVRLTAQVASRLAAHWPVSERKVWQAHHAVNVRGVAVDFDLIRAAQAMQEKVVEAAAAEVVDATGGEVKREDLTRVAFLISYLNHACGMNLTTLASEYLERALKRAEKGSVAYKILRARSLASRSSCAKFDKMLSRASADGRIHGEFAYCGADTGRWASRGVQIHNLAKPERGIDVPAAVAAVLAGNVPALHAACAATGDPLDGIVACVRPALHAPPGKVFACADYASIEPRGAMWLAGDEEHLDWFRQGREVYCEVASRLYGRTIVKADKSERDVGKVATIAPIYQMGAGRLDDYAKSQFNVDLTAAGTSPEAVITWFRREFFLIPKYWYLLQDAAIECVAFKRPTVAGKIRFTMVGTTLLMHLPSGRALWYREAALIHDEKYNRQSLEYTVVFFGKPRRERTYGGKLLENATQAICRDVLASALVRVADPCVMHVHDELVVEIPEDQGPAALERLLACMTQVPEWATGFPVAAEGWIGPRYKKA